MTRGTIAGVTATEGAIHLAGVLAELGITRVTLAMPGSEPEVLPARRTDLPARIVSAPDGSILACESPAIRVFIGPDGLRWESDDTAAIQSLSPT